MSIKELLNDDTDDIQNQTDSMFDFVSGQIERLSKQEQNEKKLEDN